jgi:hypothetical protein
MGRVLLRTSAEESRSMVFGGPPLPSESICRQSQESEQGSSLIVPQALHALRVRIRLSSMATLRSVWMPDRAPSQGYSRARLRPVYEVPSFNLLCGRAFWTCRVMVCGHWLSAQHAVVRRGVRGDMTVPVYTVWTWVGPAAPRCTDVLYTFGMSLPDRPPGRVRRSVAGTCRLFLSAARSDRRWVRS